LVNQTTYAGLDVGEHMDDFDDSVQDVGEKDVDISEEDILNASDGIFSTRELVYADVAMSIAEEQGIFSDTDCLSVSSKPADHINNDQLRQAEQWENSVQETDVHDTDMISGIDTGSVQDLDKLRSLTCHSKGRAFLTEPSPLPSFDCPAHLNKEQRLAFSIIANHLRDLMDGKNPPQLLMQIHGQAGTGKTTLVQAITDLFKSTGNGHRLAKTALSGVAASQIGGSTLHSWATIPGGKGLPRSDSWINRPSADTAHRRYANMHDKWVLLVDETSMMTLDFLWLVSQVVTAFRAGDGLSPSIVTLPFAGLTVILIGDFHQFPPIGSVHRALFSQNPSSLRCQLGKNIYEQFTTVVTLQQQMRVVDTTWNDILQRARVGGCTASDLKEIRRLVLVTDECVRPDFSVSPWDDAILITPRNSVQVQWNNKATVTHSMRSGSMLYICSSEDSAHGVPLTMSQRLAIARLPLKHTEQLPTVLRLAVGMRVMVTRNIAVKANLSNGSRGRISHISLDPREAPISSSAIAEKQCILRYPPALIILELDFCDISPLPGLKPKQVPLVPMESKFTIGSHPSLRVTRRQLPLSAAYAFTDFKSQGQTIDHIVVDIGKTSNFALSPFNAYVALSRSRGRDSIRLLRDFEDDLFTRHPSEYLRVEDERIEDLSKQTEINFNVIGR
jgi:hypothetical protein